MRRAARRDDNEPAVKAALESMPGVSVVSLNQEDLPDLLVGVQGINLLLEVKDEDKPPSKRKLRKNQQDFHDGWPGQVVVVESPGEAVEVVLAAVEQKLKRSRP